MALPLQTQWTLVASGIVAHADHVLAGEECERLMALVDQEVDEDEYAQWMTTISDRQLLQTLLEGLAVPPPSTHREILEEAWLMAVVDGERADEELGALKAIADRLGVKDKQLDSWRAAWTTGQSNYAEVALGALAWVLDAGGSMPPEDRPVLDEFVHSLPTTHEHRESLLAKSEATRSQDDVQRKIQAQGKSQRRDLVRRLFEAASRSSRADEARARFRTLVQGIGMSDDEVERLTTD